MSLTEMENYRELILENIEYDCLKQRFGTYREDCRSQRNMETIEIDRIFQTLPFPQSDNLFDKPPMPPFAHRYRRKSASK